VTRVKSLLILGAGLLPMAVRGFSDVAPNYDEAWMLRQIGLDHSAHVTYLDSDKHLVAAEQFLALISHGHGFNLQRNNEGNTAVLTLKAATQVSSNLPARLPSFDLIDLSGHAVRNSDLAGRFTLISFFFSDCAPCIQEVPTLNAFAARHTNVVMLAVTFDPADVAKFFAHKHRLTWRILTDARPFIDALSITGFPTLAVIDPNGGIVASKSGASIVFNEVDELQSLETWFESALAADHHR
jgi:peroxiredoxin